MVAHELFAPDSGDFDYQRLFETLKSCSGWWHYMDSTWLVCTQDSPENFAEKLLRYMSDSDHLLVIRVTDEYAGSLPERAWDWLETHLSNCIAEPSKKAAAS